MRSVIFTVLCLLLQIDVNAQNNNASVLNADSLVHDFEMLVDYLEQTHPDPYTAFGGKVPFRIHVDRIVNSLLKEGSTLAQFTAVANGFLAQLKDGHTVIHQNNNIGVKKRMQADIAFKATQDELLLRSAPQEDMLGARLVAINGVKMDSLAKLISQIKPCENIYGVYGMLTNTYSVNGVLQQLFPQADTLTFEIKEKSNKHRLVSISFNANDIDKSSKYYRVPITDCTKSLGENYMGYSFVDGAQDIMVLRVKSLMARENFETTIRHKWQGAYEHLQNHYKWTLGKEMPADTSAALAGVPSLSEICYDMLIKMRDNRCENLIIDLRANTGGWTPLTMPTLYMMYGAEYLKKDMGTQFYRLVSELLLRKENRTIESYSKDYGKRIEIGDYVSLMQSQHTPADSVLISQFIGSAMCAIAGNLPKDGTAIYTPKNVYVLTDEWTFSAAFHYAFYLWKMGAKIAGVTTSQAPNTFMEVTPFSLSYTGLTGSISNSAQFFLPADNSRAQTFTPDITLRYEDYRKYNFDLNSELLYLIDYIKEHK